MQPVFSIIVPTHNRPTELANCLRALTRQRFLRQQFEVIVVDDGGSVPVGALEKAFSGALQLQVISQTRSGPATARNLGAQNAQGKYLAFTDDDCEPSESWLESAEQCLRVHPGCVVGGRVLNALTSNPNAAASQLLIDFLYTFYTRNGIPRFFVSNNFVLSREAFQDIRVLAPALQIWARSLALSRSMPFACLGRRAAAASELLLRSVAISSRECGPRNCRPAMALHFVSRFAGGQCSRFFPRVHNGAACKIREHG